MGTKSNRCCQCSYNKSCPSVHSCTEQALSDLMKLLDSNPDLYKSVLKKRRREEKEEEGLMSYFKVASLCSSSKQAHVSLYR